MVRTKIAPDGRGRANDDRHGLYDRSHRAAVAHRVLNQRYHGGLFGAFTVVAALLQRSEDGKGHAIRVGLFENCLLLVAQHMVQFEIEGREAPPMPEREFSWPVYDIFSTRDHRQIFIGAVSEGQWDILCGILELDALAADPRLQNRMDQIAARDWTIPNVAEAVAKRDFDDLIEAFEPAGIPFSPIHRPAEMYDDPHVNRPGRLQTSRLPEDQNYRAPGCPVEIDGVPPKSYGWDIAGVGDDTAKIRGALGLSEDEIGEASGMMKDTN